MRDLLAASRATTPAQSLALARKVLTAEGGLPQQIEARAAIAASPWSRFWARYEPTASLRQLNCPTLVVFAEMDLQTTPQVHAPAIAAANRDACAVTLAGLNHALQPAITGAPSEYREIATTVAPEALSIVCDWIEKVALA